MNHQRSRSQRKKERKEHSRKLTKVDAPKEPSTNTLNAASKHAEEGQQRPVSTSRISTPRVDPGATSRASRRVERVQYPSGFVGVVGSHTASQQYYPKARLSKERVLGLA